MRADRALTLTLAALAAVFGVYLRVKTAAALPHFDPDDDTGYFHVEGAFQYRYAKMLAYGDPIPEVDKAAQWPEGVRLGRDVSLLMERFTAWTNALAGERRPKDAFHGFVMLWICFVSGAGALALYLLGLRLSGDGPLSAACAFAYAAGWLACSVTAGTYGFQSFALPLLFFCTALLAGALSAEKRSADAQAAGAAVLLAAALESWHFSRFFLLTVWGALAWSALRADAAGRARAGRAAAWLCAGAALAGLLPVLRETRFLASPAFLAGPALWAFCVLERRRAAGVAAGLAVLAVLSRPAEASAYGHVWGLLADKLRFGLSKPEDPTLLSIPSRLLWSGPFNSPERGFLFFAFFPLALLALFRWGRDESTKGQDESKRLVDALTVFYLFGSVLVSRLTTPLAFFLCALPAAAAPKGRARNVALAAALAVGALEAGKTLLPAPINPLLAAAAAVTPDELRPTGSFPNEKALLEWLRHKGGGRPAAANFGLSASLLAYGGVPVLIHPKFETEIVRRKTAEYLAGLYGKEEDLKAYCDRYGAKLLVYGAEGVLDETKDGPRYMAGKTSHRPESAAYRLHFSPQKLAAFKLIYENEDYRVFAVGRSTEPAWAGKPDPIYDLAQFSPAPQGDGSVKLDVQDVLGRRRDARLRLALARLYTQMRLGERGLAAYDEAFALWPPTEALREEQLRLRAAVVRSRP